MPERVGGGTNQAAGRVGVGEVELLMPDARIFLSQGIYHTAGNRLGAAWIFPPGLVAIVRRVMVQEKACAKCRQLPGDGVSDAGPSAGACD